MGRGCVTLALYFRILSFRLRDRVKITEFPFENFGKRDQSVIGLRTAV